MAKVLNIDSLKKDPRKLVLNGKEHAVLDMSVSNFIETTRAAMRLVNEEGTVADRIEASVEMIKRSIPTLSDEELQSMGLEVLSKIVSFVRLEDEEPAPPADQEGAAPNA